MKPEAQRIAMAEACGWKRDYSDEDSGFRRDFWRNPANNCDIWSKPPDYLNDLNAMHEAEKVLTREQMRHYDGELIFVTNDAFLWSATAAQRAEAFLRTIGRWDESA